MALVHKKDKKYYQVESKPECPAMFSQLLTNRRYSTHLKWSLERNLSS